MQINSFEDCYKMKKIVLKIKKEEYKKEMKEFEKAKIEFKLLKKEKKALMKARVVKLNAVGRPKKLVSVETLDEIIILDDTIVPIVETAVPTMQIYEMTLLLP